MGRKKPSEVNEVCFMFSSFASFMQLRKKGCIGSIHRYSNNFHQFKSETIRSHYKFKEYHPLLFIMENNSSPWKSSWTIFLEWKLKIFPNNLTPKSSIQIRSINFKNNETMVFQYISQINPIQLGLRSKEAIDIKG